MQRREDSAETSAAPSAPRVVLLQDEPAEVDEFSAEAHARVASAIAETIDSGGRGRVIGLEGTWGAGKSTIVRLVKQRLHAERSGPNTRLVIFDAWAHEGDPLRRTFLESLMRELEEAGWLDASRALGLRRELTGKSAKTRTRATSRLTPEGQLAAAAAVLVPLGAVLFSDDFKSHEFAATIIGGVLLVAPLTTIALFLIAKFLGVLLGGRRADHGLRARFARIQPFSFFAKDQETNTTTEGIELGEPTSVEFERLFTDVVNASLDDDRRLVIVLDNIDRVDEATSKAVIATMQTFMGAGFLERVWTLIPYDAGGLDRLWQHSHGNGTQHGPFAEERGSTSAAFFEKVFQVRFEAPPLVLSDWRNYLLERLREALPSANLDTIDPVVRLRSLYPGVAPEGLVAAEAPTPRQLKQFVNQLGALRRQRDDVELVHMAYYALLRRDRIDTRHGLLEGSLPHRKLEHLFAASVKEDLAALHFGTDATLAQQLLLTPALEDAFASGNADALKTLRERPGFVDALDSVDVDALAADGAIELTRATSVLVDANAFEVPLVDRWAVTVVEPLVRRITRWRIHGRESGRGLAWLFVRVAGSDESALGPMLERVESKRLENDDQGRMMLEGVAAAADEFIRLGRGSGAASIKIDLSADELVASMAFVAAALQNPRAAALVSVTSTPGETAEAVADAISANRVGDVKAAVDVLARRDDGIDFEHLAEGVLDWLREEDPTDQGQLAVALFVVDSSREHAADRVLTTAADDGTLMQAVAFAHQQDWFAEAGAASVLNLVVRPAFPEPTAIRQSATGASLVRSALVDPKAAPDLVAAQAEWLAGRPREAFNVISAVLDGSSDYRPWFEHHVKELRARDALHISQERFLEIWRSLRRILGTSSFNEYLREILDDDERRRATMSELADPALAVACLDSAIADPEADYITEVRHAARRAIEHASRDDWQKALMATTAAPLLKLAVSLSTSGDAPADPAGLQDALHAHFEALARGEEGWQPDGGDFAALARLLSEHARRVLASQFCAQLEGRNGNVGAGLFPTYGQFLSDERAFRTHAKLPNVIERFVSTSSWDVVAWFVSAATVHRDMLDATGREDEMEHLRNVVRQRVSDEEELPDPLGELADLLGVASLPEHTDTNAD